MAETKAEQAVKQLRQWIGKIEHLEDAFRLLNTLNLNDLKTVIFKAFKGKQKLTIRLKDKPETTRECLRALGFLDADIVKYIPVSISSFPIVPQPVPIRQIVPEVITMEDAMDIEYNIPVPVKREEDVEELLEVRSSRPSTLDESARRGSSADTAINLDDEEDYSNKTEIVVSPVAHVVKRKKPTTQDALYEINPSSPPAKKSKNKSKDKEATNVIKGDELERKVQEIFQHPNVVFVQFEIEKLFKQPQKN